MWDSLGNTGVPRASSLMGGTVIAFGKKTTERKEPGSTGMQCRDTCLRQCGLR